MAELVNVDRDVHDLEQIRTLFLEYQAELGIDLCFQSFDEELAALPGKYAPPQGRLYLVREDSRVAGCGALREIEPGIAELKRIYIRPEFRGKGLAEWLSRSLIEDARTIGYSVCRLDTLAHLEPAVRLYQKLGFQKILPYNFNPEPDILYFELALAQSVGSSE